MELFQQGKPRDGFRRLEKLIPMGHARALCKVGECFMWGLNTGQRFDDRAAHKCLAKARSLVTGSDCNGLPFFVLHYLENCTDERDFTECRKLAATMLQSDTGNVYSQLLCADLVRQGH